MKKIVLLFLTLSGVWVSAQTNNKKIDLRAGTVAEKFDEVYQKSGKYQQYKVVDHLWLKQLKKQVLDSLQKEKATIVKQKKEITTLKNEINTLKEKLQSVETNFNEVSKSRNQIGFLGAQLKKGDYKLLMWSLVGLLGLLLAFFVYKFKNSNKVTVLTKENFVKLEEEYNSFRANALEREQLLKRQLLDEQKKHQS